ncbi:MAG: hypothetical protein ABS84_07495 [Rubrivivax sp. SCN 71-131]|nr:MAG: hypothetical protein ABS84_07495 [Rubrivivax sp. SCN 71-131]
MARLDRIAVRGPTRRAVPLGLELVVARGRTRTRVLPGRSPGTYPFFDEFHMQTTRGEFVIR